MKNRMLACALLIIAVLFPCDLLAGFTEEKREPWMDSVIAEGVRKIRETEAISQSSREPYIDLKGEVYGTHTIIIDAANWTPQVYDDVYYYERSPLGSYGYGGGFEIRDSIEEYNVRFKNHLNYISYYNIVIHNLPFPLEKDVSTVGENGTQCMFAQLQALGSIDNQKYYKSSWKLKDIIDGVVSQANSFSSGRMVCYGIANMLGQYSHQSQKRASFAAEYIGWAGLDTTQTWVRQLSRIPELLSCPFGVISPPSLREKNTQVSMGIRNFIMCNQYGVCVPSEGVFTNMYARWLYGQLANASNIDKQKLFNTCMQINPLSLEMAWSVITSNYEDQNTAYNAALPVPMVYTNQILDEIIVLTNGIKRGAIQLKNNSQINRDSALYFGRLLYRIPSYISEINCTQRVKLIKVITSQVCNDITGATSASDYLNHCERICKAIYTHVPQTDIRPFMDEMKSSGTLWDVTYRLDNTLVGFYGNDNYTDFIFTISYYWKIAYPELAKDDRCLIVKWSSEFFNSNNIIQSQESQNRIVFQQQQRVGWQYFGLNYTDTAFIADVYDPVMIHVKEGSFIPDLPGVKDLVVPAIFMDWLSHKKNLDDAATTVRVSLAVAALVTGVGEFIAATSVAMRVISIVEVAVSSSDLVLLNGQVRTSIIALFPTPAEGEAFLRSYENITMMINLSVAMKGLIQTFDYDVAQYVTRFDNQQSQLKVLLGEHSAEFKGMQKLRNEINAANDVINSAATIAAQRTNFWETWITNCFPNRDWNLTTFQTSGLDYQSFNQSQSVLKSEMLALGANEAKISEVIESGSNIPQKISITKNQKFYKLVPKGNNINGGSVYYIDQGQLNALESSTASIEQVLGLPLASTSAEYDVFSITYLKDNGYVFQSNVAPTNQFATSTPNIQYETSGGALQTIIFDNMNSNNWSKSPICMKTISPTQLPNIGNQ
jgi:hypothetical protein